ncbi:uncharacterized protein LOC120414439 [Culex pipiens pallens]|uniref:uncharacterized protein LOC120414439 n=1 Tax=Culex pipiens pallens TaxID=42434 RepID=UPI00195396A1|nr:uncharacterized protein LOC120414439 [Culex pipiens pallens]
MDKILVAQGRSAGQVEETNDEATILKAIGVENPAAKILVDMSRVQDDEVGDETTSVTSGVGVAARGGKADRAKVAPAEYHRRVKSGHAGGTFGADCRGSGQLEGCGKVPGGYDEHCPDDAQLEDSVPA